MDPGALDWDMTMAGYFVISGSIDQAAVLPVWVLSNRIHAALDPVGVLQCDQARIRTGRPMRSMRRWALCFHRHQQ